MSGTRRHTIGSASELRDTAEDLLAAGRRLALAAAHDDGPTLRVVYLFLATRDTDPDAERRVELHWVTPSSAPKVPSLAYVSFPASRFEREMRDLYGIRPVEHPHALPLVRHSHWPRDWHPMRANPGPTPQFAQPATPRFGAVDGPGVYEIPVGPVHAGLIEPGHFRFSVVGETVLRLKARLWYVHRGIEKLFQQRPALAAVELAERVSGDTSAGHALAHVLAVEDALGITVPDHVTQARAMLLELERLYNHAADLGALANDVGFALANAHALRLRERLLRLNQRVTGHRLLRGAIAPGGITLHTLPNPDELAVIAADMAEITALTLGNAVVYDRFAGTSILAAEQARELGCLGPVARASGLAGDARLDHPTTTLTFTEAGSTAGDVLARYTIRRDEFAASIALVAHLADTLDKTPSPRCEPDYAHGRGVGIVEGWRGTIVHRVEIRNHRIARAKIVDPSWFNWPALPVAMTDTIVPDFPLTNKSFNLSYAGNDL